MTPSSGTRPASNSCAKKEGFHFRFDDDAATDEIDNVADFRVTADGELGTGKVAQRAFDGLVLIQVCAAEMEDAAIFHSRK